MNKFLLFVIFLSLTLFAQNESFPKSKQELRKIHKDHQVTFYCGCKYNYSNKDNMIDRGSCGYVPRNEYAKSGKKNERARRIEFEHVVPVPFIFSKYGQEKSPNLYVLYS
jgi:deoxyribonuclease-1